MMSTLLSVVVETTSNVPSDTSWFEWKVTVGDVLTLLGIIVALIEFGVSSHKSRKQELSNQKESWFLNVIVLPQLETINNFYQTLIKNIKEDEGIVANYKKDSFDQCTFKIAELKNARKQEINDCFDHVVALVMSYDESLGREISDVVMALEDVYVEVIDCYVKNQPVENIRERFLQNKQILISKLNTGLKK